MRGSLKYLREGLRKKPGNSALHNEIGNTFRKMGSREEAVKSFLRAVEIRPKFDEALNMLGELMLEQGDRIDAREYFQRALSANPRFEEAKENLKKVDEKK